MILAVTMNPAIDKIYLVNSYKINEVHRPVKMIASAGGKGLNVARVAKQVGRDVAVTGFLGGGNGQYIRKKIVELGLIDRFVEISDETRICINVTDTSTKTCTEVLEEGPTITTEQSTKFLSQFEDMLTDISVVTLSGSLPKSLTPDFYKELISICHEKEIPVLLDSSGDSFINGMRGKPFAIKPNEDEIKSVYKSRVDSIDDMVKAIIFFKNNGIQLPIISLGKDGSLVGLIDGVYKVSFPTIDTVNTVGSGDSFIAGLASGIDSGLSIKEAVVLATACGSANTQYEQTGFVELKTVNEFKKKVIITKRCDYDE